MSGQPRTDAEIVDEANDVARELYRYRGYVAKQGYRFDRATHPHEVEAWRAACYIMERFTHTDPEESLRNLDDEEPSQ